MTQTLWPKSAKANQGASFGESKADRSKILSYTGQRQIELNKVPLAKVGGFEKTFEGFDPGSERTLAAWIRHASRGNPSNGGTGVRGSKAWVPTLGFGIAFRDGG